MQIPDHVMEDVGALFAGTPPEYVKWVAHKDGDWFVASTKDKRPIGPYKRAGWDITVITVEE